MGKSLAERAWPRGNPIYWQIVCLGEVAFRGGGIATGTKAAPTAGDCPLRESALPSDENGWLPTFMKI
ncbi:MAG: hypothetical protein GY866_04330 [Proteobacteria bacterium]|nr:hypothetical protein [Pseudomonadota bacterium]